MSEYGSLATLFYELDKPEAPPDALDFYAAFARELGGPIHEPMCGTGRFLLPLLAEGLDVTGSDASSHMLAACTRRAREIGLSPRLSEQAVERLSCVTPPRLVMIPLGSFGLLIEDELVRGALRRLHEVLAPGGVLLVEAERLVPTIPEMSGAWGGRWVPRADGAKLLFSWLSQYSGAANITTSLHRYELIEAGRLVASEYVEFRVRSYALDELGRMLSDAGFVRVDALKPYARAAPDADDDAVVFFAQKA
jgi:SAM-dependent methyltransferase